VTTVTLFDAHHDFDASTSLLSVFKSGNLAGGPPVLALENAVSDLCQHRPVVSVVNMTEALCLALHLAGVGVGDDVLTMSFNCMSSNVCINMVGANGIWVDVDPVYACIDLNDVHSALTPATKALIVYQLAGYAICMDGVIDFCRTNNIALIEDANNSWLSADAHKRKYSEIDFLYFTVFSLYANRQINGIEGALLVCPSTGLATKAKRWTRFGIDSDKFRLENGEINPGYDISDKGINASLNAVSASLAFRHLKSLSKRIEKCRLHAEILLSACEDNKLIDPIKWKSDNIPSFWVFLIRSTERELLKNYLKICGIQTSFLHFPNHLYSVFNFGKRNLPGTVLIQNELLALPCGWWLSESDIFNMAFCLRNFSRENKYV
jgi:perosamine synthetase